MRSVTFTGRKAFGSSHITSERASRHVYRRKSKLSSIQEEGFESSPIQEDNKQSLTDFLPIRHLYRENEVSHIQSEDNNFLVYDWLLLRSVIYTGRSMGGCIQERPPNLSVCIRAERVSISELNEAKPS